MRAEDILILDGAQGEGGGQILRTALVLSAITGRAFQIDRIRARRKKPGLRRQHLTCVEAAAALCGASVDGAQLGATSLRFMPGALRGGDFHFDVGSAGSTTLVLQTALMPLLFAGEASTLEIEGGTHNPMAPPVEFLERTFLPCLGAMGAQVSLECPRRGYYPAGSGRIIAKIHPARRLAPFSLSERGALLDISAVCRLSLLPDNIAARELEVVRKKLGARPENLSVAMETAPRGPGNALLIFVRHEHITEVFTGFGEKAVSAEKVATDTAREAQGYLQSGAAVGAHLADQLLLPMALGGGGTFRTVAPTEHTRTNARTIAAFLGTAVDLAMVDPHTWDVTVSGYNGDTENDG